MPESLRANDSVIGTSAAGERQSPLPAPAGSPSQPEAPAGGAVSADMFHAVSVPAGTEYSPAPSDASADCLKVAGPAVEAVLSRYADMVYRLAFARVKNRFDADDILQEVFLRYIRRNPVFNGEEHRRAWLIRVTINCSRTSLSSAWSRLVSPVEDTLAEEMETRSDVYYAVMELPVRLRTVVHLHYYEGLSVPEIAGMLDCSPSAVKSRLHRARAHLREVLSDSEGLED